MIDTFCFVGIIYLCCKVHDICDELRHIRAAVEGIADDFGEDDDNAAG